MNIPLNGRITIVDDKYEEVKPLMQIFSKKRIPFNYYTGLRNSELPEDSDANPVTLIFLDLNIVESQHESKTVISTLHPILKALCPSQSKPYLLVIWSKKINAFADDLETHFKEDPDLINRVPVKFIRLDKLDFFDFNDGKYRFEESKYDSLVSTLSTELENFSLLNNFWIWENIVHQKASETISEFSSFYPISDEWDKNSKAIIFHLAKSIVGDDVIIGIDNKERLVNAFVGINSFLAEKIEDAIHKLGLGFVSDIQDEQYNPERNIDGLTSKIKSQINQKLHLSVKDFQIETCEQGYIYKIENQSMLERVIWDKIFHPENPTKLGEIRSSSQLIELDITPVCDYSQNKQYVRLISGILTKPEFKKYFKSKFFYITPIIEVECIERIFVFDFRYIKTIVNTDIVDRNVAPSFKLRKEICTDIQSQLANQVNRPGISNL